MNFILGLIVCFSISANAFGQNTIHTHSIHNGQVVYHQPATQSQLPNQPARLDNHSLVNEPDFAISFEAKGLNLFWDVGMMAALHEQVPKFAESTHVLTGSSSGSILASFFSCYGISPESIKSLYHLMMNFDTSVVNENPSKAKSIVRSVLLRRRQALNYTGSADNGVENEFKRVEFSHSKILPILQSYLKPAGRPHCRANLPTLIVATNGNITKNYVEQPTNRLSRLRQSRIGHLINFQWLNKIIDYSSMGVTHNGRYLGKACTYFADPIMFARLQQIPENERLCDIRLMESADDLITATLASISEPSYYRPLYENPQKYHTLYNLPQTQKTGRYYRGGMVMMNVIQDVKRLYPGTIAIGAGRAKFDDRVNNFIKKRFAVNINRSFYLSKYWLDIDIVPHAALGKQLLDQAFGKGRYARELISDLGFKQTTRCLQGRNSCKPKGRIERPIFSRPVCLTRACRSSSITTRSRGVQAIREKFDIIPAARNQLHQFWTY